MRIKKEIQEHWKRPVSRADAWKAILLAVLLIGGILAFGQVIFHSRFERMSWAVLLLVMWIPMAKLLFKHGWRVLQNSQGALFIGCAFFAVGNVFPPGTAASWLTNIGALLLVGAGVFMLIDFRKSRASTSTETMPPL